MDEAQRAAFLERFRKRDEEALLGFAVLGGVFGEGVDLTGESLIGAAIVSPGLPQIGPRQEQLRDYFEKTRGTGFDYAYRYPGMNKVLQLPGGSSAHRRTGALSCSLTTALPRPIPAG